jgi:hypothetical protein
MVAGKTVSGVVRMRVRERGVRESGRGECSLIWSMLAHGSNFISRAVNATIGCSISVESCM